MSTIQPDRRASASSKTTGSGRRKQREGAASISADRRTASAATGRRKGTGDRRSREHLRELCDEVLASYRVAVDGEPLTGADRAEAERLLAAVAPLPRG